MASNPLVSSYLALTQASSRTDVLSTIQNVVNGQHMTYRHLAVRLTLSFSTHRCIQCRGEAAARTSVVK